MWLGKMYARPFTSANLSPQSGLCSQSGKHGISGAAVQHCKAFELPRSQWGCEREMMPKV